MPACARVNTFHSKEQRVYSQQAQAMLAKTPEFQKFAAAEEQTEELRLSWILGLMFFLIMMYCDVVVFFTEQGDGKGLLGGFLRLKALPPLLSSVVSALFLIYPVGWILLAPWFGIHGPVEYTRLGSVCFAHLLTAALFALATDLKVGTFLEEWRLPTAADYHPLALKALLPTFLGALVPLVTGLLMRWWLCSGSWRTRRVQTAPHLWLPPLHFLITVPVWIALTFALRHLMTETEKVTPLSFFQGDAANSLDLVFGKTADVLQQMANTSNVRHWQTKAGALKLNEFVVFTASYALLLLSTHLELFLFSPLLKRLVLPGSSRVLSLYIAGLSLAAYHLWKQDHAERPLVWYMVAGYISVLLVRGHAESESGNAADAHDPADDPK